MDLNSGKSFECTKNDIRQLNKQLIDVLVGTPFEERLIRAQEKLKREQMNILVIGEFSRGKSTFINCILGQPVLPTKVNPTTATINVIKGGPHKELVIDYFNGEQEVVALPERKVNKFLDDYVTTKNEQANTIRKIDIVWPDFGDTWNCQLVDTPGVNDLDDAREEVTFKYLSEADACFVILDSQQPLSQSERRFIQDRVLENDIHRLIFIINRADEIGDDPCGDSAIRIKSYVEQLIKKEVPSIKEPIIYNLSSKEALRARFTGEDNVWSIHYDTFEKEALAFTNHNAKEAKLTRHMERLDYIFTQIETFISEKKETLEQDEETLSSSLTKLETEQEEIVLKVQSLQQEIENEKKMLCVWVQEELVKTVNTLKRTVASKIDTCESDEDILNLKSSMANKLTLSLQGLINEITNMHKKMKDRILISSDILIDEQYSMSSMLSTQQSMDLAPITNSGQLQNASDAKIDGLIVGGAVGWIAGALFGPIGIIAGIVGFGLMEESKKQKRLEQGKIALDDAFNSAMLVIRERAIQIGQEEGDKVTKELMKGLTDKRKEMDAMILEKKKRYDQDESEHIKSKKALLNLKETIKNIKEAYDNL